MLRIKEHRFGSVEAEIAARPETEGFRKCSTPVRLHDVGSVAAFFATCVRATDGGNVVIGVVWQAALMRTLGAKWRSTANSRTINTPDASEKVAM